MKEIDRIFKTMIIKSIDSEYHINNNRITVIGSYETLYPQTLSERLVEDFDISKDLADHITFNWLFENDFINIMGNWELWSNHSGFHSTISHSPQQGITIVDGNSHNAIVSGNSNAIVLGGNDVLTTSGSSYTMSMDVVDSSSTTILQINSDGNHEWVIQ
jgi:hypothetical protein